MNNKSLREHWREFFDSVQSTSRIDPGEHAYQTSPNRFASLSYALGGWLYMLRYQRNTWLMAVATPLVLAFALWLRVSTSDMALLIVVVTIVWLTEFLNAAVEASIDMTTTEYHPMAKVGKDVAAAAVLLGVIAAVLVGLLVLGPPLLVKLGWLQ